MRLPSLSRVETHWVLIGMSVLMLLHGLLEGKFEDSLLWALSPWVGYVLARLTA